MNEKLKSLISIPKDDASCEDDASLVEELKKAQLIMPIEVISSEDSRFKPITLSNPENNIFIPLFTDEDELIKGNVEFSVINIYTENLVEMIRDAGDEYFGIAINPFSEFSLAIPLNDFLDLF